VIVRVPASSANLGPGFDALGMALTLYTDIGLVDGELPDGARVADEHHPATIAFRRGGGVGEVWTSGKIPMGRGLGFSGAVRVGGLVAAHAQRHGSGRLEFEAAREELLAVAAGMEGHPDNVAASLYGGVVAASGGRAIRIPTPLDPAVVVWIPSFTTSTDESRHRLSPSVSRDDAVFNIGRTAVLVAALAAGDIDALRIGAEDRLHQDHRLRAAEPSRTALTAALDAGAWSAWLSGSGPTVAALCDPAEAESVAASLPNDGHTKVLRLDPAGTTITADR
jgi:homoserine kinase